ncbi:hypothetical protein CBS101457_002370 [Exobasidium rhododendri]|nr:hypothetical protein CBS101457_002370 [Exobasidium rhododendri]
MLRLALPILKTQIHFQVSKARGVKMAAFSDPSFNFKAYLENRPRYPDLLYETVLKYHKGPKETVLDLGCGPGLSLFPFAYHFKKLIGVDPSQGMIGEAQGAWQAWKSIQKYPKQLVADEAQFSLSSAENLSVIESDSVDLITAATAAHWFDHPSLWPELGRVLKSNGTVAFWTYASNYLPSHPDLASMMMEFMNSHSENLGPYWPQPGRSILENLLADVPFPFQLQGGQEDTTTWDENSATRVAHKLASDGIPDLAWTRGEAREETFRMEQVITFDALNGYFHTSSASMQYFKKNPDLQAEKPDLIDRHVERLRNLVLQERSKGVGIEEGLDDDHIRIAWPLGLMMIRKA